MRFLTVYGRVIRMLGRDLRVAGMLSFANLMVAGLQFLDPVLFGRVIDLLSTATDLPPDTLWHAPRNCWASGGPWVRPASAPTSPSRCRPSGWRTATACWRWHATTSTC